MGHTKTTIDFPVPRSQDVLTDILRSGAQQMLVHAIDSEVAEWIASHAHLTDEAGHRQVVRNGYHGKRKITTGLGQLEIEQPRVHDRRNSEERKKFTSKILPPYLRKTKSIEELISLALLEGDQHGRLWRSVAVAA
ncbi:MAG: IS256 family transposase, partial [Planctomycetes bacterium]|nr:IS256 family transposase [Planctomycetota bacterium]